MEKGLTLIDENTFSSEESETWLFFKNENILVGIIRLFDIDDIADGDGAPLFDIRISKVFQGQGIGTKAVATIAKKTPLKHVFKVERNNWTYGIAS